MLEKNKKSPKWYLIGSIITGVLVLLPFWASSLLSFIFLMIWGIVSFVVLMYLLAKEYSTTSFILPIFTGILSLVGIYPFFYMGGRSIMFLLLIVYTVIAIGLSLYLLWKE